MADKTRKAVIDALHRAYMDHEDFKMTTDLLESLADAAIATLHHAEAGAVAWMYEYEDDGMTVVDLSIRPFRASWKSAKHATETPLFLHPAQPASQQGEKIKLSDLPMVDESKNGDFPSVETFVSHPTGDKVRELVAQWRKRAWDCCRYDEARSKAYDTAANELAAALDQEKGR